MLRSGTGQEAQKKTRPLEVESKRKGGADLKYMGEFPHTHCALQKQ